MIFICPSLFLCQPTQTRQIAAYTEAFCSWFIPVKRTFSSLSTAQVSTCDMIWCYINEMNLTWASIESRLYKYTAEVLEDWKCKLYVWLHSHLPGRKTFRGLAYNML